MNPVHETISLDDVSVIDNDQIVLRDIHMVINKGEFCYLKGDTGVGKSSFLKGLFGMNKLIGSHMKIVGYDFADLDVKSFPIYRRKIGFISNAYPLYEEESIFYNLDRILALMDWAVSSEREKRVNEVLDKIGLSSLQAELITNLPPGLRQKVSIARSVLNKPALILADNPMVFLDSKSVDDVMNLFIDMVKESKTSILCAISDDTLSNKYPARSYLCADGTITESR